MFTPAPPAPFPDVDEQDDDEDVPFTTHAPAQSPAPKHDTRKQLAVEAGVSTGQVGMAEQLAVEAEEFRQELGAAVEVERRAKQAATQAAIAEAKKREAEPNLPEIDDDEPEDDTPIVQLIAQQPSGMETRTVTKTAAAFNTNRTYVNQAVKLKHASPEVFAVRFGKYSARGGDFC